MRAVVVKAPHAPLQALGIYQFETRGFQPRTTVAEGDPLAIVLGKSVWSYDEWPDAWKRLARSLGWPADYNDEEANAMDLAEAFRHDEVRGWPLGSVVTVATFGEALPCVDAFPVHLDLAGGPPHWNGSCRLMVDKGERMWHVTGRRGSDGLPDISDQRPLGDFTPGRFGWLLSDPHRLTDPVPVKGKQGVFTLPDDVLGPVLAQLPERAP